MGKHHSVEDTGPITLGDLLPTMVITDYVSAMTVYTALTNAANDYNRIAKLASDEGKLTTANRYIDNATRCRNLADLAYAEACNIAEAQTVGMEII